MTFPRFENNGTCATISTNNFVENFFNKFRDAFLFCFVLQFLLVSLMFTKVGKGIYWKVLFYSSLAGLCAALMESTALSHMCLSSTMDQEKPKSVYLLLVDEVFWIISEYSIPILNLIKMKAFATGKAAVVMKIIILGLGIPFCVVRFLIGYTRMSHAVLDNDVIQRYHGYAFGIMAIADIICTFGILFFVRKNNSRSESQNNLNDYIKHSSYTILVTVDIVSALLAILDLITVRRAELGVLKSLTVPLQCLKSSFALILAIDAFLFKYGANITSINESTSGGNSKYAGYGNNSVNNISYNPYKSGNHSINNYSSHNYSNHNYSTNNYSSNGYNKQKSLGSSFSVDMTLTNMSTGNASPKKSTQSNIVSPYNYPTLDKENYNKSPKMETQLYHQKSIIKNYTGIQANSIFKNDANNNDPYEIKVYPSKNFGFLNAQAKGGY